jgi:hypothetical protein
MSAGPRTPRFALLFPLGILLGATVIQAESRFLAPGAGAGLESGETVRLAWSLPETRFRKPDEMELVLSLDGGRTFSVRVTRDLPPETRSFAWRVPALPTAHAQLALRTGEHGNEEIELVGDEFSIEIGPGDPIEPTTQVGGEWRTGDALGDGSGHPLSLPASLAGAEGTIGRIPQIPAALMPKPPQAAVAGSRHHGRVEAATSPPARPIGPTLPRTPSAAPMRA